jgi:hypothetical protein
VFVAWKSGQPAGSHCPGVGGEVRHSRRLPDGPEIHGQEVCGTGRFPCVERLFDGLSEGHLVL